MIRLITLSFVLLNLRPISLASQDYLQAPPLLIEKTKGPIVLDGFSNEEAWAQISPLSYIQFQPDWGREDTLTQLRIAYDDRFLYVAARCYDPEAEKIVARNLIRDGWNGDDWFTFHIDSYGDKQSAFVFSMYPTGSRYDMSISNDAVELGGSTFNRAYDMVWEGKCQRTRQGWFLEMRIPLSNLRFRQKQERIEASISSARTINHRNELYVFPAIPQDIPSAIMRPSVKQPVVFKDLRPKKQLLVSPFLLGGFGQEHRLNEASNKYIRKTTFKRDLGLDVRYGLSSSLTLDLSLNTDFAQVEADDQQINLSRYSLFFPERRRFFQEQAGLFEFNMGSASQLFYSRVIGLNEGRLTPIIGGLRLTGKLGRQWDLGVLNIQTAKTPLDDRFLPSENFGVLRLRRKVFNQRSFLGAMLTNRYRPGYANTAFGLDGLVYLSDDLLIRGALAASVDPKSAWLSQSRFYLHLEKQKREDWFYTLSYNYSGKNFRPEMGFLDRSRFHHSFMSLHYGRFQQRGTAWLQYFRLTPVASDQFRSLETGRVESWLVYHSVDGTFFSGDQLELSAVHQYESLTDSLYFTQNLAIAPGKYYFPRLFINYASAPQRKIPIAANFSVGRFYQGYRYRFGLSPEINFSAHFSLTGAWQFNYLRFPKNQSYWINIAKVQLRWAANLHLSGSLTAQYNSNAQQWFTAARLRYNFRDGHDLYLVYNDHLNQNRFRESIALPLSVEQTLLAKYIYTFK